MSYDQKSKRAAVALVLFWNKIDWKRIERRVVSLQQRIVKAIRQRRFNKVKALQRILTQSYHAKLLAIRRVTSNKSNADSRVAGEKAALRNA